MARPRGRPNQGKTETIRERCVTVYLPTKELVEEWKGTAKKAGMPVSRYVYEVVERHRRGDSGEVTPSWKLEEQLKTLQAKLGTLQEKYDNFRGAFEKQEKELRQVSDALVKASQSSVDPDIARGMIDIFLKEPGKNHFKGFMIERLGIRDDDTERLVRFRDTGAFLERVGLIEPAGFMEWRWKAGGSAKKRISATAHRRIKQRKHRKA
jgi:hypothetical protein